MNCPLQSRSFISVTCNFKIHTRRSFFNVHNIYRPYLGNHHIRFRFWSFICQQKHLLIILNFLSLPISVLNWIFQVVSKRLPRSKVLKDKERKGDLLWDLCKICLSWIEQECRWWLSGKESPGNAGEGPPSAGQEDSLYKEMATHSICLGKFHGQRSLVGRSLWGHSQTGPSNRTHTSLVV